MPRSRSSFLRSLLHKLVQKKSKSADKSKTTKKSGVDVSTSSSSSSQSSLSDAEHVVKKPPTPTQKNATVADSDSSYGLVSTASAGPYVMAPVDGRVFREETVEQVYRIRGGAGDRIPRVDPLDASVSGVISKCAAESSGVAPKVTFVEDRSVVRNHGPVPDFIIKEASLPHSTVHTWHEISAGPETVTTEVDEHGNIIKRTLVKSEQVKHTVHTQSYQTFVVDENTAPAQTSANGGSWPPEKASRSTLPKLSGTTTTNVAHTVAYETNGAPTDVTNSRKNGAADEFTDEDLVSKKAVTTGNRTVETLTYKKEKDGGIETHVEHRITIHGSDNIDHDAELSRAILEATNMNPEMTVEKVEIRQENANN